MNTDINIDITYLEETDSTNKELKRLIDENKAEVGKVIVAWKQSEGRGRLGRSFYSPKGGIYMSMLLPLYDQMTITAKTAVAVRRAIAEASDKNVGIKWVNDIIYMGKKVCGILAEVYKDKVIVGLGINFCTKKEEFPEELREIATSLYRFPSEADCDEADIVNSVVKNMYSIIDEPKEQWLGEYRYASVLSGQEVEIYQAGTKTGSGIVSSIDDSCALHVIDKDNNEMVLSTGEVSVRKKQQVKK